MAGPQGTYTMFVNGKKVGAVSDTRIASSSSTVSSRTSLMLDGHGGAGLVRISNFRVYALKST